MQTEQFTNTSMENNVGPSIDDRTLDSSNVGDSSGSYAHRDNGTVSSEFDGVNNASGGLTMRTSVNERDCMAQMPRSTLYDERASTGEDYEEDLVSDLDTSMEEWNKLLPKGLASTPMRERIPLSSGVVDSADGDLVDDFNSECCDSALDDTMGDIGLNFTDDSFNENTRDALDENEYEFVYETDAGEKFDHERYDDIDKLLNEVIAGKHRLKNSASRRKLPNTFSG